MKWRNTTRLHWLVVALAGLMALVVASFGVGMPGVARATGSDGQACYKIEDPTGAVPVNFKGLVLTLHIGTYPQDGVAEPNKDNAVTSVQLDPSSLVTTGTIIVKGGDDLAQYTLGATPPLHAPALTSNGKWPTISYVQVCPGEPVTGRVDVTKVVNGTAAPNQEFTISLTPNGGQPITQKITGPGTLTFNGLTPGVYTLSEANPGEGWTVAYSKTSITVVAGGIHDATVTNTYVAQLGPTPVGSVIVTKVVSGDPPSTTYEIGLVGPAPATTEHWRTITVAGEITFSGLPVGTYTVVERDPGSNYTVTISPKTVTVTNGGVARATVTNAYAVVESSAGALPQTGSTGIPAMVAAGASLALGGTALAALSRRRKIS